MKTIQLPTVKRLTGFVSVLAMPYRCLDCNEPCAYGSEERGDEYSLCKCEDKRVECDDCGEMILKKDMSLMNMFLCLCKKCNAPSETQSPVLLVLSPEDIETMAKMGVPQDEIEFFKNNGGIVR